MADENRMITFEYARINYDAHKKQTIPSSNEAMTKTDVNNYINADTSLYSTYAINQLVPRGKVVGVTIASCNNRVYLIDGDLYMSSGIYWSDLDDLYFYIPVSSATGNIDVSCEGFNLPDKFTFYWDDDEGTILLNTGYLGAAWTQQLLNEALDARGLPRETIVAGSENIVKTYTINKTTSGTRILVVRVASPVQEAGVFYGANWRVSVGCPAGATSASITLSETSRGDSIVSYSLAVSGGWTGKIKYNVDLVGATAANISFSGPLNPGVSSFNADYESTQDATITNGTHTGTIYITGATYNSANPYDFQQVLTSIELLTSAGLSYNPPKILGVTKENILARNNPAAANFVHNNIADPKNNAGGSICFIGNQWTKPYLIAGTTPAVGTVIYKKDGRTPAKIGFLSDWSADFNTYGIRWVRFSNSNNIWNVDPTTGTITSLYSTTC